VDAPTRPSDLVQPTAVGTGLQALELAGKAMELAGLAAAAAGYAAGSKAVNTRKAYRSDWEHYTMWCALCGLQALPAEASTVCLYLTAHAGQLKVSTLRRRLACISQAHRAAGVETPTAAASVRAVWAGISRAHGAPPRRKTPLVVEAMRQVLDQLDYSPRGQRDRALLLICWAGALRRSEVCALRTGDVVIEDRGAIVTVRRGKTDQVGEGRAVGIPFGRRPEYCPVRSYQRWASHLRGRNVPVFVALDPQDRPGPKPLADRHVARLVKRVCDAAGLVGDYSGHSLRAGFATAAAAAGASERAIMAQTGHKSILIARGYIRPATLFEDNAAAVAAL
jgi:integrase